MRGAVSPPSPLSFDEEQVVRGMTFCSNTLMERQAPVFSSLFFFSLIIREPTEGLGTES